MLSIIQKIYLWVGMVLLSTDSVFACMNDFYTRDSETLWGLSYQKNTTIINIIISVIITLIIAFILFKTYKKYEKKFTKNEIPFTIFMGIVTILIVIYKAFAQGIQFDVLLWICIWGFFLIYIVSFLYHFYLLIRQTRQSWGEVNIIFILFTLLYFLYTYYKISEGQGDWELYIIIIAIFTNLVLLFSIYVIKCYRHRVFTICAILIFFFLILSIFPGYLYGILENTYTQVHSITQFHIK